MAPMAPQPLEPSVVVDRLAGWPEHHVLEIVSLHSPHGSLDSAKLLVLRFWFG